MSQNKKNKKNNEQPSRLRGLLALVAWALILTIIFNYASVYLNDESKQAEVSEEIAYSDFRGLVKEDQIEEVKITPQLLHITPKDSYVYKDEKGNVVENVEFYTVPLNDPDLYPLLEEHGVRYTRDYVPEVSPILTFFANYILPFVLIMLMFSLFMRIMQKRGGGIGGEIREEPVLVGTPDFLQDMGVEIPAGTMVSQAVYAAIDGQLCAVYAISYAKMRSAAAGLVTLNGYRKITPVMLCGDFMLTEDFIRSKFDIKTRRIVFPDKQTRAQLKKRLPDPDEPVLAMTTRNELVAAAYAVTGAKALRQATKLAVAIHLLGGILGILIMLVLAYLGNPELLTPTNILLYQLVWALPGLLITEWTRTV